MKKSKIAAPDMPRTSPAAMAPKVDKPEPDEDDLMRNGEYDMEHLLKAEDIKNDPDKMKYVKKAHAKKTTQMRSIADLKMAGAALDQQKNDQVKSAQGRIKTRYPETK